MHPYYHRGTVANLSQCWRKAANLLRTRVDVELSGRTATVRLRTSPAPTCAATRTTVEGLPRWRRSATTVGLFGYLVKGATDEGMPIEPSLAVGIFVPVAVLLVWWVVRRIRRRHMAGPGE